MKEFIVLSKVDMWALCNDKPITIRIDKKTYELCTDECFKKQMAGSEDKREEE